MLVVLPAATAIIIAASTVKVSAARDNANPVTLRLKVAKKVNFEHNNNASSPNVLASTLGDECVPISTIKPEGRKPDIGLLSRCHPIHQVCAPDESSSFGGRCQDKAPGTRFKAKKRATTAKAKRNLQMQLDQFVCPATCPAEMCACSDAIGYPDAQDCASEMNSVCTSGATPQCFNNAYLSFYDDIYCEVADCFVSGNSYEDCTCGYYQDYCTVYGSYADAYPDIAEKCRVAACCEGAVSGGDKFECIPGTAPPSKSPTKEPSKGPTNIPTNPPTDPPSTKPTQNPTPSSAPSSKPSVSPTISPIVNTTPVTSSESSPPPTKEPTGGLSDDTVLNDDPTAQPSPKQSSQPSIELSSKPSSQPTTVQTTLAPSSQISSEPSVEETPQPTTSSNGVKGLMIPQANIPSPAEQRLASEGCAHLSGDRMLTMTVLAGMGAFFWILA